MIAFKSNCTARFQRAFEKPPAGERGVLQTTRFDARTRTVTSDIASGKQATKAEESSSVPWIITTAGWVIESILELLWWSIPIWWLLRFSPPLTLALLVGIVVLGGTWAWWKRRQRLHLAERRRAWRAEQKRRREQARAARASSQRLQN